MSSFRRAGLLEGASRIMLRRHLETCWPSDAEPHRRDVGRADGDLKFDKQCSGTTNPEHEGLDPRGRATNRKEPRVD